MLVGLGCETDSPVAPTTTMDAPTVEEGVRITTPSDGDVFSDGQSVSFTAIVGNVGGVAAGNVIDWTSSLDGEIGMGPSFMAVLASVGTHQITATVKDVERAEVLATASITITVAPLMPPQFRKTFSPASITPSETSRLTFTIDNNSSGTAATALAFTDTLPERVTVFFRANEPTDCTAGTLTIDEDVGPFGNTTRTIRYTGGRVEALTLCTLVLDVTAGVPGTYVNTTGDLTSSAGNSGSTTATLNVTGDSAPSLTFTKEFIDDPVIAGGTVVLQFTIENLDAGSGVADLSFSDDLDAVSPGLLAFNHPGPGACGAGSIFDGQRLLTLSGGNLPPGGQCTFHVLVVAPETPGVFTNRTSLLLADGEFGASSAADDLTVIPAPTVDGAYGPGMFTRGPDTCVPAFFGQSFTGTATITGGGTQLEIGEFEIRNSLGSIANGGGVFDGAGFVGMEPATWHNIVTFDANGNVVIEEGITLTQLACGTTFFSDPLPKMP